MKPTCKVHMQVQKDVYTNYKAKITTSNDYVSDTATFTCYANYIKSTIKQSLL